MSVRNEVDYAQMMWGSAGRKALFFPRVARALLAVLLLPLAGKGAASPGERFSSRVWRIQDGLPQNRVQCLAQTPEGYLWVGTSGGLARFDGVRFVVFNRANTPELTDDSILSLAVSKDGSLWIGTEGGGLVRHSRGRFRVFGAGDGLTNSFVRALAEDSQGRLWIGTDRGLFRMENGALTRLDDTASVPVISVLDLHQDRQARMWIAAGGRLLVAEKGSLRVFPLGAITLPPHRISTTASGWFWMGNANGLYRRKAGVTAQVPGSESFIFQRLYEDSNGDLWIATLNRGLLRLSHENMDEFRAPEMLPINAVHDVLEDREHNIWAGTQDGLVRLSRRTVSLLGQKEGLLDENAVSLFEDSDGSVWVATVTGEFYRIRNGRAYSVRAPVEDFRARTAFRDSRGDLWLGSYNRGVVRISGDRAEVIGTSRGLRSNSIRQLFEDRQGNIWMATGSGLSRWDGQNVKTYYLEDGLAYGSVRVIVQDLNGDLIVGTDAGANRIRAGRFVQDPALEAVGRERVWSAYVDKEGTVWLGTRGGGLFRIRGGKVARITARHGLIGDSIYQILEDERGRFWFSGPAGILSVSRDELNAVAEGRLKRVAAVPYGVAEGLVSSQMNGGVHPAGCRRSSGELWFPSVKGVVRLDPKRPPPSVPSAALIEALRVEDRALPLNQDIRIPPGRGRLEIQYTACELLAPERITFQYKLEGFDSDWIQAGPRRTAYYTNLPPGRYRFRVARLDAAASQSPSEASVSFVWEPHFYETRWFYGLITLLTAAAGWAGFLLYARQTQRRYNALLEERVRLAREMHDTVIQGCVGVSTLLEAAAGLDHSDAQRKEELLNYARLQVRSTLEEARQAVWDLRRGSAGPSLSATVKEFAARLMAESGIPVEVRVSGEELHLEERTGRNLTLIVREAMRNAAAHARPARIEVNLDYGDDEVRLEVADDGKGFELDRAGGAELGHYGIAGMRERAAQSGGSVDIVSAPGQGTRVLVVMPCRLPRRKHPGERHEEEV